MLSRVPQKYTYFYTGNESDIPEINEKMLKGDVVAESVLKSLNFIGSAGNLYVELMFDWCAAENNSTINSHPLFPKGYSGVNISYYDCELFRKWIKKNLVNISDEELEGVFYSYGNSRRGYSDLKNYVDFLVNDLYAMELSEKVIVVLVKQ